MKAYGILIPIILTLCITLSIAVPAAARSTRINFEAHECTFAPWGEPERPVPQGCRLYPPPVTYPGGYAVVGYQRQAWILVEPTGFVLLG